MCSSWRRPSTRCSRESRADPDRSPAYLLAPFALTARLTRRNCRMATGDPASMQACGCRQLVMVAKVRHPSAIKVQLNVSVAQVADERVSRPQAARADH
jgi:hypothetical protein